jgi:hypothetical protein
VESRSTRCSHKWPIVPAPGDYDDGENRWNDWQGKPKYSEKTCPSAALSTTNPTCCPYANPGRRGGKPASNRLSYGTTSTACNKDIFSMHFSFHHACYVFRPSNCPWLYLPNKPNIRERCTNYEVLYTVSSISGGDPNRTDVAFFVNR